MSIDERLLSEGDDALHRARQERDQAQQERDRARQERDQAQRERDQARLERDQALAGLRYAQREWNRINQHSEQAHKDLTSTNIELERLIAALQKQERMKMQFYANMNHELRTPLSSIIGFAEDAVDGLAGELSSEQKRYVSNILHSSQHLLGVITELLDLAKLQAGKEPIAPQVMHLKAAVAEAEAMMTPMFLRKGQYMQALDLDELPAVYAEPGKVVQILLNLFSNAHKYSSRASQIRVSAVVEGDSLKVSVSDTGAGIAADDIPHLFEEFTRVAQKKGRAAPTGTGLGLAITQHLVESQGGHIEVESQLGEGSTFSLTLPLAPTS